jgi:hypothetical protein
MTIKQTLVERVRADRGRGWDNGSTISWTLDIVPLVDAYDALLTEVETLREQRRIDNEEAARLYDFARDKGQALERASVVALLRESQRMYQMHRSPGAESLVRNLADIIERGEHRREEER